MHTIGITGGIGSGKSTISRCLQALGYPVFQSDDVSKELLHRDADLKAALQEQFGAAVYDTHGQLDRAYLSGIVFNDSKALERLNALVHPAVFRAFHTWQAAMAREGHQLAFKEAAILYEAGAAAELDAVIVVSCPQETRIARVMQREGVTRDAVLARMAKQWPEDRKLALADYVIVNDGVQPVLPQLQTLLQRLKAKGWCIDTPQYPSSSGAGTSNSPV
jgi:dephospho-CoA kinase